MHTATTVAAVTATTIATEETVKRQNLIRNHPGDVELNENLLCAFRLLEITKTATTAITTTKAKVIRVKRSGNVGGYNN